jgi:hypothetical protein
LLICREGDSQPAKDLAEAIQNAFRGNVTGADSYLATISDLPVPIRNFSQCPTDFLPDRFLDQALHTLVVLLVDEKMKADKEWASWIRKCEQHVAGSAGRHQIIALCATGPLKKSFTLIKHQPDKRYSEKIGYDDLQKNEELAFGEHAERPAWFALYILQACRHLLARAVFDCGADKEKLKLKLFISHAKKDSLPLANSIRSALNQKEYFATWYDAEDLAGVDDWRQAIEDGVNNSVVIVLRTEQYDTRPWCRQEFVWADQCAVPIVCVEARNSLEYAADALAASRVPTVRIPDGNLFRILFLALKEGLRIMQLERCLLQLRETHVGVRKARERLLIPYTPNLRNLAYAAKVIAGRRGRSRAGYNVVLYADPPLAPELYQASKSYIEQQCGMTYLLTSTLLPFWSVTAASARRTPKDLPTRSLLHKQINISISEHNRDLKRLGLTKHELNGFVVQMAQALIANEAIVALGHDWRDDGVLREIYRFAEQHQDVVLADEERSGLIRNYAFWGMKSGLGDRERRHLRGILDIVDCDGPDDLRLKKYKSLLEVPDELHGYALARALSNMRRTMTNNVFARVCLGGRDMDLEHPEKGPSGRCPGVVEEALLSCLRDKPLYLSALLGGVTEQVINAIEGRDASLAFELPEIVATAYAKADLGKKPDLAVSLSQSRLQNIYQYDGPLASGEILQIFRSYGIKRLAVNNGLSQQENRYLFAAATIDEVIGWVLTGLARLRGREESQARK